MARDKQAERNAVVGTKSPAAQVRSTTSEIESGTSPKPNSHSNPAGNAAVSTGVFGHTVSGDGAGPQNG